MIVQPIDYLLVVWFRDDIQVRSGVFVVCAWKYDFNRKRLICHTTAKLTK
jgi:hypothetical protein